MPRLSAPPTSYADMLLIRELYAPTDGSIPLTAGEIAQKFEIPRTRVYTIVQMSDWRLELHRLEGERTNGRSDAQRIDPTI